MIKVIIILRFEFDSSFLDYIDFVHKFVAEEAKKLVDIVHESGKSNDVSW